MTTWFEPIVATRKREDISNLIRNLMEKFKLSSISLPEIAFPTIDGQLVEPSDFTDEHADFEEDEEMHDAVSTTANTHNTNTHKTIIHA